VAPKLPSLTDSLQFYQKDTFQLVDIIELIQSAETELPNLLLSRTASILDMGAQYADGLLEELQGSLNGTEEVLRLKLLDLLRVACGHQLLKKCSASELKELVSIALKEDKRITDVATKLSQTKALLASQSMGPTTGLPN
jgi:hypothetical protein